MTIFVLLGQTYMTRLFCVQHKLGYWLYIWYSEYDDIPTSVYLKELESLINEGVLNVKDIQQ